MRQTRINPPRTSSVNRANPLGGAPAPEQPINVLPGVTCFADGITALPKELVRHFTLLKEVDAKIFAPETTLFQLFRDALNTAAPDPTGPPDAASSGVASASASASARNSTIGAANPPPPPFHGDAASAGPFHPANIPRRTLFRDTALKIQEMLIPLEEKNHVIVTANDILQKQLARIEEIWPHLEAEFSDEAKWGSTTHWAYVENRQAKANDKQAERSRREGAATLSAAAQQLAEEAAARSSDRKQAMAAKKNPKNQAADAEADRAQDAGKKAQGGGKSRKPLPDAATPVGLGITHAPPGGGGAPSKRRKVETAKPNGGTPTERAMSTVFGNSGSKQKTTSPRETPAPESGAKKRKALPTSGNQAKRRQASPAALRVWYGQGADKPPVEPTQPCLRRSRPHPSLERCRIPLELDGGRPLLQQRRHDPRRLARARILHSRALRTTDNGRRQRHRTSRMEARRRRLIQDSRAAAQKQAQTQRRRRKRWSLRRASRSRRSVKMRTFLQHPSRLSPGSRKTMLPAQARSARRPKKRQHH